MPSYGDDGCLCQHHKLNQETPELKPNRLQSLNSELQIHVLFIKQIPTHQLFKCILLSFNIFISLTEKITYLTFRSLPGKVPMPSFQSIALNTSNSWPFPLEADSFMMHVLKKKKKKVIWKFCKWFNAYMTRYFF